MAFTGSEPSVGPAPLAALAALVVLVAFSALVAFLVALAALAGPSTLSALVALVAFSALVAFLVALAALAGGSDLAAFLALVALAALAGLIDGLAESASSSKVAAPTFWAAPVPVPLARRPPRGASATSDGSIPFSLTVSRSTSAARPSRLDLEVTDRLRAPRTGVRGVKIQPTPGTGLPPMSRPGSNSQGRSAWNS